MFVSALAVAAAGLISCRQTVVLEGFDGGSGGGGNGGANGTDSGGDTSAGDCTFVQSFPRWPSLVIALDRSSEMYTAFGSGTSTRLSSAEKQIQSVVQQYQAVVAFGYEEFPGVSQTCPNNSGCCAGDVVIPIRNNMIAINNTMSVCDRSPDKCASSSSERPMADALSAINDVYAFSQSNGQSNRYVMLVTGMEPTCSFNGSSPCQQTAIQTGNLNNNNNPIRTMVVGVGDDLLSSPCLDMIASAGGMPAGSSSPFYSLARTPSDLHDDMAALIEGVAEDACTVDVRTSMTDPSKIAVLLDGTPLPFSHSSGWDIDSGGPGSRSTITLHGDTCGALLASQTANLAVYTNCSSQHM